MSGCSADKRARLTFIRQRDPTLFLMVDIELGTGTPGVPSTFPPYSCTPGARSRSEVRLAGRSIGLESIQGQIPAVIHRPWGSACFFSLSPHILKPLRRQFGSAVMSWHHGWSSSTAGPQCCREGICISRFWDRSPFSSPIAKRWAYRRRLY
jgi:hypothetical protein